MRPRVVLAAGALALLAASVVPLAAQDGRARAEEHLLGVRARARASAPADRAELELSVVGVAENASEAERIHRGRLAAVLAALTGKDTEPADAPDGAPAKKPRRKRRSTDAEPLPTPGVADEEGLVYSVREGRYSFGAGTPTDDAMDDLPEGQEAPSPEVRVGSTVIVALDGLATAKPARVRRLLARALDRAIDAGAEAGSASRARLRPILRFRVADRAALERAAYAEAVARGRAHALELAKLAGGTLGRLASVDELDGGGPPAVQFSDGDGYESFLALALDAADDTASLSSTVVAEASLELRFELRY